MPTRDTYAGKRREEVLSLVEEIYKKDRFAQFGQDWQGIKLSEKCVLMGHSHGGTTMLDAAADCPRAAAIISFDPWFMPMNDKRDWKVRDEQKVLVTHTEHFKDTLFQEHEGVSSKGIFQKLADNCKIRPSLYYLKEHWHQQCTDFMFLMPLAICLPTQKSLPEADYKERCLMHAWMAIEFMEKEKIVKDRAQGVLEKMNRVRKYISPEWL